MQDTQDAPAAPETLTLDSAMGLLSAAPEEDETAEASAPSGEAGDGAVEDAPAVDPPASWPADDQALFQTLPREIQERIAAREQDRERAVNAALRDQAALRKGEAEQAALEQAQRHATVELEATISTLHQALGAEFKDIRSPADELALAQSDPARYAVLKAKQNALAQALIRRQQAQIQAAHRQEAETLDWIERERQALLEKRPELRDGAKARKFLQSIHDYAGAIGYPAGALDGNLSHRDLLVLEKAMLYDRAQQARASAMERPVPRVQSPGTVATRDERAAEERTSRLKRLEKSGRIEDARGLLRL